MLAFGSRQKNSLEFLLQLYSSLAQSVEHSAVNRVVVGSSPTGGAKRTHSDMSSFFVFKDELKRGDKFGFIALKGKGSTNEVSIYFSWRDTDKISST